MHLNSSFKTVTELKVDFGLCISSQTGIKGKSTHVGIHDSLTITSETVGNYNSGIFLPY